MDLSSQIINEYGVLKKIFSYLPIKDLILASKVNQHWKSVADIIINENNGIQCYLKYAESSWPKFNAKIRPKLIMYNNDCDNTEDLLQVMKAQLPEVGKLVLEHFNFDETFFIYLANWKFINTLINGVQLKIAHSFCHFDKSKNGMFRESLVMIPEFANLKIDGEIFNMNTLKPDEKDYCHVLEKINKSKCCLFLTDSDLKSKVSLEIIKLFCDNTHKAGNKFVMAGGISHCMMSYDSTFVRVGGAVVIFSGESLSAKSFLISHTDDLNDSFTKIREELGPLQAGYVRLAFLFSCVDRYYMYDECETEEFSKFFPDTLLYGFWSLGEFCYGYTPLSDMRKKRVSRYASSTKQQFFFRQASSYLILTFKK